MSFGPKLPSRFRACFALALALAALNAVPYDALAAPTPPPVEAAAPARGTRVLLVSIDGLRPDLALRANLPNLRRLIRDGSFTFYAETTEAAATLPSHVSMLTGNPPEVHGITWNDDVRPPRRPDVPTLFELAKGAGRTTALVSGKARLRVLVLAGGVDWPVIPEQGKVSDDEIAERAVALVREHRPEVLFVHFAQHDAVAHAEGWGSAASLRAAEAADAGLGRILAALEEAKLLRETLVVVTADHGGAGKGHGGLDPRSRLVPWIVAGPGVIAGRDLTLDKTRVIHVEDTFATALWFLGVPLPARCAGTPVEEAFAPAD